MDATTGEVTELLRQFIRNRCVNDGRPTSGEEERSARLVEEVLSVPGVEVERLSSLPGRSSTVARIEGSDPTAPTLALVGHLDVVPASPTGWSHDPFGADLEDGIVWGRGAVDMLNLTAAMVVATRRLATSGFRPRGTLVLAAVADEEAGGVHGAEWLLAHHPELVDADMVLSESGGIPAPGPNGTTRRAVMVAEKGIAWSRLRVRGTPGHGSRPFRTDNALVKAARVVAALADYPVPTTIGPVWREFVAASGLPAALAEPSGVEELCATSEDLRLARLAHACTHLTISPNVAVGGTKTNIIPDEVVLEVDFRTLPGQGIEDVRAILADALGELAEDVTLEVIQDQPASASPAAGPLWEALERVATGLTGPTRLVPGMLTGGTDARLWRQRGAVAYGVGLFSDAITPEAYDSMFHGRDEHVDVESLGLSAAFFEGVAREVLA
jgi:acetylornithine deacetylase/succinyl-diaminopimelate desuccinylase-like protein